MGSLRTKVVGYGVSDNAPEEERIKRLDDIATSLVTFCEKNCAIAIGVEEYAFSQMQSRAHALGEVGGSVKLDLYRRLHLIAQPIVASTARKSLLQHLPSPRGKPKGFLKSYVVHNVKRLGGPTLKWTDDEIDAFVIANHRLADIGGLAMTFEGEF